MRMLMRAFYLPLYLLALVTNLMAEIVSKAFSFIFGLFSLIIFLCILVTILNHAWNQTFLLIVIFLGGYGILFGMVALKVMIEEFKNFCFQKVF